MDYVPKIHKLRGMYNDAFAELMDTRAENEQLQIDYTRMHTAYYQMRKALEEIVALNIDDGNYEPDYFDLAVKIAGKALKDGVE